MDEKLLYWPSVVLGILALSLLIINITLFNGNRDLQAEINQRQAVINSGITMNRINQTLVQLLADTSVKNNDPEIRALLAEQGITVKPANAADDATKDGRKDKRR